jgi:hypothetical protein
MRSDNFIPMDADEYRRVIEALGLTLEDIRKLFNHGRRTVTRHANDEARIPLPDAIVLRALRSRMLTMKDVNRLSRTKR